MATPVDWRELGKAEPNGFDPRAIRRRLARKADPWRDIQSHAGSAARALEKLG